MKMKEIGPRRGPTSLHPAPSPDPPMNNEVERMYEQWLIQKLPGTDGTMFLKSIENNKNNNWIQAKSFRPLRSTHITW